jgi:hypothetical protein
MKSCHLFIAFLIVLAFTGCATVPMANVEKDNIAKSFSISEGKANIYLYRNEVFGGAIKFPVVLDDRLVGDTAAKTYMLLTVTPGVHTIISKSEKDSELLITVEEGKNYFVWQEVKMGLWAARSRLHLVDEATGKAGVSECKLIDVE